VGTVLRYQKPRQGQVLVLAQVVRAVICTHAAVVRPLGCGLQVAGRDMDPCPHRRNWADVWVEAVPIPALCLVEKTSGSFVLAGGGAQLGHGDEPPVPVLGDGGALTEQLRCLEVGLAADQVVALSIQLS
jgi:hypothetical protein